MSRSNTLSVSKMMRRRNYKLRLYALLMSLVILYQLVFPTTVWALTGGPSQPEVQSFEPVGTTDMVDLFSGDFNYNIPLLDVEGYPVNISYHGGITADQEASWVGLGWNINPGSINRNLRGLPDDFKGDEIKQTIDNKPNIVQGGGLGLKWELIGNPIGGDQLIKALKDQAQKSTNHTAQDDNSYTGFSLGINLGIKYNNYKGYGLTFGVNPSLEFVKQTTVYQHSENGFSHSSSSKNKSIGMGLSFDSQEGADIDFNLKKSQTEIEGNDFRGEERTTGKGGTSKGASIGFNSRSGLKQMSFSTTERSISFSNYNATAHLPYNKAGHIHFGLNAHLSVGPEVSINHFGLNFNYYYSYQANRNNGNESNYNGYGSLYHSDLFFLRPDDNFQMDFNRHQEMAVGPTAPFIPYATLTQDLYSATAQGMSGSFKVKYQYVPVVHDKFKRSHSTDGTGGIDLGYGGLAKFGWDIEIPYISSKQGIKKLERNERTIFTRKLQQDVKKSGVAQPYFKNAGELTFTDENFFNTINGLNAYSPYKFLKNKASFDNTTREPQNNVFQYLTLSQLKDEAGDVKSAYQVYSYTKNSLEHIYTEATPTLIDRESSQKMKNHHIASISTLSTDGTTYEYNIPTMNLEQVERSFTIKGANVSELRSGVAKYELAGGEPKYKFEKNNYYHSKQTLPPYAYSYLLTGVKSPDYIDIGQDGISDDDYGTAVKFNYTKVTDDFHWRAPIGDKSANLNPGMLSKDFDDRVSYLYGTKEIWYLHSIESKNFVALFYLEDERADALGVKDELGEVSSSKKLMYLRKIVLYNKADLKFHKENAVPIKTVHFVYNYDLCKNTPNSVASGMGKLTLQEIYFTYGNSNKGAYTGYKFHYSSYNPNYNLKSYDRWGNYSAFKDPNPGSSPAAYSPLSNAEFPYTTQDKTEADLYAEAWNLTQIDLPSGGSVKITYEADDYAYVQDKKAMQMMMICGVGKDSFDFDPAHAGEIREMPLYSNNFNDKSKGREHFNYLFFKRKKSNDDLRNYFDGIDTIYFSAFMRMVKKTNGDWGNEHVTGFVPLEKRDTGGAMYGEYNSEYGWLKLKPISITDREISQMKVNPMVKMAFNFAMSELSEYVYPGSNTNNTSRNAGDGLLTALSEFKNFFYSKYKTMMDREDCRFLMCNKSFVRLNVPDGFKIGGGSRVKRIELSDQWPNMQNSTGATYQEGKYGQSYDYTTTLDDGTKISSGVASYEPSIGNMENPFKKPIVEVIMKNNSFTRGKSQQFYNATTLDRVVKKNYLYHIGPVGEEFYPGASVGYSKVTVHDLAKANGKTVSEFYTAKDFPTIVDPGIVTVLSSDGDARGESEHNGIRNAASVYVYHSLKEIKKITGDFLKKNQFVLAKKKWKDASANTNEPKSKLGLDLDYTYDFRSCYQGYAIINNDMHGKLYKQEVYAYSPRDKKDYIKSSVTYIYKRFKLNSAFGKSEIVTNKLDNKVLAYDYVDNSIQSHLMGTDIDITYDKQEDKSFSADPGFQQNIDESLPLGVPVANFVIKFHAARNSYKTRVLTKVIHQTGILEKVIATEDGASVSTENLLFDKYTGEVLLTKTQNEFNDPIYNLTLPARYTGEHGRMGPADYNWGKNLLLKFDGDQIDSKSSGYKSLIPGDELLIPISDGYKKVWVHENAGNYYLLDDNGGVYYAGADPFWATVIRSGNRNMLHVPMGSYVLMSNPVKYDRTVGYKEIYKLEVPEQKVLNVSASTFSEKWLTYDQPSSKNTCNKFNAAGFEIKKWVKYLSTRIDGHNLFLAPQTFAGNPDIPDCFKNQTNDGGLHYASSYKVDTNSFMNRTTYSYSLEYLGTGDVKVPIGCNIDLELKEKECVETNEYRYIISVMGDNFYKDATSYSRFDYPAYNALLPGGGSEYDAIDPATGNTVTIYIIEVPESLYNSLVVINTSKVIQKEIAANKNIECKNYDFDHIVSVDTTNAFIVTTSPEVMGFNVLLDNGKTTILYARNGEHCFPWFEDCCIQCSESNGFTVNPYLAGTLGIWRKKADYVYHGKRKISEQSGIKKPDLRQDGVFSDFSNTDAFWQWNSTQKTWTSANRNLAKWQQAQEVTVFNPHGNEIENKDALGIYSSAQFGYNQKLPVAVAKNSKYTQMGFDGFEDYILDHLPNDCNGSHFGFLSQSSSLSLDSTRAHTGLYSGLVQAGDSASLTRFVTKSNATPLESYDPARIIMAKTPKVLRFQPDTGTYLIGGWIQEQFGDTQSLVNRYQEAHIKIILKRKCDDPHPIVYKFYPSGPVIEGWQRVEGKFKIPEDGIYSIEIKLMGCEDRLSNFDDIRVHPYAANMKSYVFNIKTLKLMAELDENNYSSLYEYDKEGQMIRVKKETIKGIVTLKEVRMGLHKKL